MPARCRTLLDGPAGAWLPMARLPLRTGAPGTLLGSCPPWIDRSSPTPHHPWARAASVDRFPHSYLPLSALAHRLPSLRATCLRLTAAATGQPPPLGKPWSHQPARPLEELTCVLRPLRLMLEVPLMPPGQPLLAQVASSPRGAYAGFTCLIGCEFDHALVCIDQGAIGPSGPSLGAPAAACQWLSDPGLRRAPVPVQV